MYVSRLLLYVAGLVYLCQLPRDEFNHRSFIDENALMTGLVRREFSDPYAISNYAKQLEDVYEDRSGLCVMRWHSPLTESLHTGKR